MVVYGFAEGIDLNAREQRELNVVILSRSLARGRAFPRRMTPVDPGYRSDRARRVKVAGES